MDKNVPFCPSKQDNQFFPFCKRLLFTEGVSYEAFGLYSHLNQQAVD